MPLGEKDSVYKSDMQRTRVVMTREATWAGKLRQSSGVEPTVSGHPETCSASVLSVVCSRMLWLNHFSTLRALNWKQSHREGLTFTKQIHRPHAFVSLSTLPSFIRVEPNGSWTCSQVDHFPCHNPKIQSQQTSFTTSSILY